MGRIPEPLAALGRRRSVGAGRAGAWALLALVSAAAAGAATYTVGDSAADCSATTIAGALALAEATAANDEIRLTRSLVYSGVEVALIDWDPAVSGHLTIRGGYDDCLDTTASGRTTLIGDAAGTLLGAVETGAVAQRFGLTLRDLELTGSGSGAGAFGNVRLLLLGALIQGNARGATVGEGGELEVGAGTVLRANLGGSYGGGAGCSGAGTRLIVVGEIRENEVSSLGGGIFAYGGCVVELRAGATIEDNLAARGGGLALVEGAWAEGGGAGADPTRIAHNSASEIGGGIYLGGPAPRSLLGNVQIESNSAPVGGGVAVGGAVRLQLERFNFAPCANPSRCVTLSHNRATASEFAVGSAALVSGGGELLFAQGYIEGNGGNGVDDAVLAAYSGTILLEGVQIWGNETDALLFAAGESQIVAGFVSAAGNSYFDEDSETLRDSAGALAQESAIELYTSILTDHGPFTAQFGGTIVGDCLMVDTEEGIEAEVTMVGVDPRFRDPALGDLHLRPDSPAIDSCDTEVYTPLDVDFDLDARGYDTPSRVNVLGPFDRGADEIQLLFADGFESGGTGAWSAVGL